MSAQVAVAAPKTLGWSAVHAMNARAWRAAWASCAHAACLLGDLLVSELQHVIKDNSGQAQCYVLHAPGR